MQKKKDKQYEKVVERSEKLRKKKEEVREGVQEESASEEDMRDGLNNRQFVTGLISGEIKDIKVEDGCRRRLVLNIKTKDGRELTVKVRDKDEYTEENPVARLLEWKNIPDGRIDDLIGENVKLVSESEYPRKRQGFKNSDWELYIPHTLDKAGTTIFRVDSLLRRVGLHSLDKTVHESRDSGLFPVFMGLMTWLAIGNFMALVLLPAVSLSMNAYLISVVATTIFFPTIVNYMYEGWERYKNYRKKDSIKESID
jgi:hypothetical protein